MNKHYIYTFIFLTISASYGVYNLTRFEKNSLSKSAQTKWIVLTTINSPTEAVKVLASQEGWRVVIVADKKTPTNWSHPNCDFLSIEKQKSLNYAIATHVPYYSYTRKMIGYLYAIQNGAEWIYDTDDDNQPVGLGLSLFDMDMDKNATFVTGMSYGDTLVERSSKRALFNPYSFWGQSKMWPRGYPLEDVKVENDEKQFMLCKQQKIPAIQQGLVKQDPDVDAVYRLLYANEEKGLSVNFSRHAPPMILNYDTYCPFNSQNTLFHRDAFWSLFLPISVNFRVTDIWRGYFAQKLLHLIGNRLGFYPSNAVQKRNVHSYLADFKDESQIYVDAARMVDFISNWTCNFNFFEDCINQLSRDFYYNKFWAKLDIKLIEAWINDLKAIGYVFPSLLNQKNSQNIYETSQNCRNAALYFDDTNKSTIAEKKKANFAELKDWCNEALPTNSALAHRFDESKDNKKGLWKTLSRLALIVTGNYPFSSSISILQRLYEHHFAIVIFCGTIKQNNIAESEYFLKMHRLNFINVSVDEMDKGFRAYICTSKAIELRLQNIDGYVTIADDTVYNFFNVFDYNRFRLGYIEPYESGNFSWWDHEIAGKNAIRASVALIRNITKLNPNSPFSKAFKEYSKNVQGDVFSLLKKEYVWSISDFYFLPRKNQTIFYELAELFFENHLFHEIAISKIAAGLHWFEFYNSSKK